MLRRIGEVHMEIPEGFNVHPKLLTLLERRNKMAIDGNIDWGFAELAAFGSLMMEGVPVRLAGQDTRRGTFVQRHAVFYDRETNDEWTPLSSLSHNQGKFWVYNSLLSEYAALGFEYGYSVERPEALVLWEAQFGDFVNGAQIVIDEFISSSQQKWNQHSSIVLLLPHGYEGQGPDHSSARIERFLQLSAENNMRVVQPSYRANHFHLLREHAYSSPRRPLIVFSPKQLLRLRVLLPRWTISPRGTSCRSSQTKPHRSQLNSCCWSPDACTTTLSTPQGVGLGIRGSHRACRAALPTASTRDSGRARQVHQR